MKKILAAIMVLAAVCSCGQGGKKGELAKKIDSYQVVKIAAPDLSGISENGQEVLRLYRWAADEANRIYWKQMTGSDKFLDGIEDPEEKLYASINYGPWDRFDGKPFLEGYPERPKGSGLYPPDMTAEEFEALADPAKNSPYTMIVRSEDGSLKAVPYHDFFEENIGRICSFLQSAADLTIRPSVREYLLKRIEALRSDDYYASDLSWIDMDDSKMDLIIGPVDTKDDDLFGIKKSYGAFVLLKQLELTEEIDRLTDMIPELQASLPCPEQYKVFTPGEESDIYAYDALYYAGCYNAGVKVIAVNLPSDEKVQAEKGTRTVLLHNIIDEKFNRIVFPTGRKLLTNDGAAHLSSDAFFWNTVFREVAHGLGVKETVNGRGSVSEALAGKALFIEKIKGYAVGLYLTCNLLDAHKLSGIVTKEDALATFFASLTRSERFGENTALGKANIALFNYLVAEGAFVRTESGRYEIDYAKEQEGIRKLASQVLTIQATGDIEAAAGLEEKFGRLSPAFREDLREVRLEGIPADIRFEF